MFCRFFSYAFFLLHRNRIGRFFWSLIPILLLFGQALTKYSYSRQHLPRAASYLSTTPHWSPATLRASPRLPRRPPRDAPDSSTQPTPRRPPPDPRGSRLLFWIDVIAKFRDERNQYCFRTHPFVCWVPTCLFSSGSSRPTDIPKLRPGARRFLELSCSTTSAEKLPAPPPLQGTRDRLHSPWWRACQPLSTTAQRLPIRAHRLLESTRILSCDVLRN